MGRRPKNKLPCDCSYCKNYCENADRHCFICLELSEFEPRLDIRKEMKGHPNARDMEEIK